MSQISPLASPAFNQPISFWRASLYKLRQPCSMTPNRCWMQQRKVWYRIFEEVLLEYNCLFADACEANLQSELLAELDIHQV
jgi:hypothetical protein